MPRGGFRGEAARAKRQAALAEKMKLRQRVLLSVGPWIVFQLDELNLVLTDAPGVEERWWYYPNMEAAATMLYYRRLEKHLGDNPAEWEASLEKTRQEMLTAIRKWAEEAV